MDQSFNPSDTFTKYLIVNQTIQSNIPTPSLRRSLLAPHNHAFCSHFYNRMVPRTNKHAHITTILTKWIKLLITEY